MTSLSRLPDRGPHSLRFSYIENIARVGLPLVTTPKPDGGRRSLIEVQAGARFAVTGYKVEVEAFEGGLFLRF